MSQKMYRIGEAATKLNLKSYVLRFWETEFPQIAPIRTEKGQRLYRESDLAVLGRIRYLLHERGLTIDGARRLLREEAAKGTLYTGAAMLSDENITDEFPDELPDDGAESAADSGFADGEDIPGEAAGPSPKTEHHSPVQASLFPAAGAVRPDGPGGAGGPDGAVTDELRAIITELAAIRRLLVADTPGEMP
ncbi:MerR regulatory family protein [uncultured delta proteobacterium]|uniref:MerR regulatory family protein n=1 Tax=uncultured delta proteobacterium TaxID=34034 RepID=A0A212JTF7_9DELT|nr:MerR regulatory family protein [uncultured delta proteobacterium]